MPEDLIRKRLGLSQKPKVPLQNMEVGNFETYRRWYEENPKKDDVVRDLMRRRAEITGFQTSGNNHTDDPKKLDEIDRQLWERRKQLTRTL